MRSVLAISFAAFFLSACFGDQSAKIVRTEQGIPHITSSTWLGLGFGYGYAYAQDNFCLIMKDVVRANGQSARYLGAEGDIAQDLIHALYNEDGLINDNFASRFSKQGQDVTTGFTDGMNRYLKETGVENLPQGVDGCKNQPWVRPITPTDLTKVMRKAIIFPSSGSLADLIALPTGPDIVTAAADFKANATSNKQVAQNNKTSPAQKAASANTSNKKAKPLPKKLNIASSALLFPKAEQMGSNAYAIGGNLTDNGRGLLLGNPHFRWDDSLRFYMAHLEVKGEYNVMGASLHGFPLINIGFNQDMAWTHTVSTGKRFTFYEIRLDPTDPMKYAYGDELRDIETRTVSIEVPVGDGSFTTIEHTYYFTHYGPIVDISPLNPQLAGWPNVFGSIFAVRDVNVENYDFLDSWRKTGIARSVDEVIEANQILGNPWTNTIAVDRHGDAFYGDLSVTPHVTAEQLADCVRGIAGPALTAAGFITLDGSDPACEWDVNNDSPQQGVLNAEQLPTLKTRNYALNSNGSYWLSNEHTPLEGFSPILGQEQRQQSLRSRLAHQQIRDRLSGADGREGNGFNNANLRDIMFGSRNYGAELITESIVSVCNGVTDWSPHSDYPEEVPQACLILSAWDRQSDVDSVGSHIFLEMWNALDTAPPLWATPFDPSQAVDTPNTLDVDNLQVQEKVIVALAASVDKLLDAGIALNKPWGELQFITRQGQTIPIHGSLAFGFSVIKSNLVPEQGYTDIFFGNAYLQVVGFDKSNCPNAQVLLSYSQSSDPDSAHYADSSQLYGQKKWINAPFCAKQINQSRIGKTVFISDRD